MRLNNDLIKVLPIPALKDNYIWVLVNKHLKQAIVVDPGEADPVLNFLAKHHLVLVGILVTHKHADHTGGISKLLQLDPNLAVYAHPLENIPFTTQPVQEGGVLAIDEWPLSFTVLHIPGHTLGHVAFYAPPLLFTGDTLFGAGCGRIFEGTAEEMFRSLNKLLSLPNETLVYCGHEYTLANLNFASQVEPDNADIRQRIELTKKLYSNHTPSLPSTINEEKKTNPFLRCAQENIIKKVEAYANRHLTNTIEVFRELREWKNKFKG